MTISSAAQGASVEQVILPPVRDLGDGFKVRRALPSAQRRMVGPFIFLDHFGPLVFRAGVGPNVRPHPHIGLSTLSYLLEGEMIHRDSADNVETIRAGDVNWMTAGIVDRRLGTDRVAGYLHHEFVRREHRDARRRARDRRLVLQNVPTLSEHAVLDAEDRRST